MFECTTCQASPEFMDGASSCRACLIRERSSHVQSRFHKQANKAENRGKRWDLTLPQYQALVAYAGCYYCGDDVPPDGVALDRLNPKLGYSLDNVVACCGKCNLAKHTLSGDDWKAVIRGRVDADPTYGDR